MRWAEGLAARRPSQGVNKGGVLGAPGVVIGAAVGVESHLVAAEVISAGEVVLAGEAVLAVDLGEGVRLGLGVVGVQVVERQDFVGLLGRKLGPSHKTCGAWVLKCFRVSSDSAFDSQHVWEVNLLPQGQLLHTLACVPSRLSLWCCSNMQMNLLDGSLLSCI